MCADFTLAQIGETSGSPVQPQRPVTQPSGTQAALQFAAGIGESLFESFAEGRKKAEETAINRSINSFSQSQLAIAEAVDRGDISSQEGRMRMRTNLSRASADNVNLAEAYSDAHKRIIETAGMGKVAAEGTEQEQAFLKSQEEALRLGFFEEGASEEEARAGTQNLIRLNRERLKADLAKEELAQQQAQLTLARGQIGIQRDRLGLQTDQINLRRMKLEQEVQEGVTGMADSYFPVFSNRLKEIQSRAQDPTDPMTAEEADLLMRQELDQVISEARAKGSTMNPAVLDNILTPYQRMYDTSRGVLTGRFSGEVADEIAAGMRARTGLMQISQDPDTLALVSTSDLLGSAAGPLLQSQSGNVTRSALNIFKENARGDGRQANMFREGEESAKAYLDFMSTGTNRVVSDAPSPNPEGEADELAVQTNSMLRGIADNGPGEEFRRIKPFIDHIASDTYGAYITSKGRGVIRKENEADAQLFLSNFFLDEIQPLVEREWRNAVTRTTPGGRETGARPGPEGTTPTAPTSTLIKPFFTGDGVRFVRSGRAEGVEGVDAEIARLNQRVAPAINTFLKAGAHLEENRDYERLFNENFSDIFGNPGTGSASE